MPLIEYKYRDTFLHNLHPLAKLLFFIGLGTLAGQYWDLRFLIPILAFVLFLIYDSKIPKTLFKYTLAFWLALWIDPWWLWTSTLIADPAYFKVLTKEFTSHVIVQITPEGFPILGYTAMTYGTLYYYFASRIKGLLGLSITSLSVHTINLSDIIQLLLWMRAPNILVFSVMVQYRFIIVFQQKTELLMRSLRLRGWHVSRSRDPRVLLRDIGRVRYPLALGLGLSFVDISSQVSKTIQVRGYGVHKKTHPFRLYRFSWKDYLVSLSFPLLGIIGMYLLLEHNIGKI